jgi:hypothetical protein
MNKQKQRIVRILLSLSAGVLLIFVATTTASAQTSLEQSMVSAGFMWAKADDCNIDSDRFSRNVIMLTESYGKNNGSYGYTLLDEHLLRTRICVTFGCSGNNPPSPYADVSCERFGQMFRSLRINQPDWQVSEGFR